MASSNKLFILYAVCILAAFAAGRYSVQAPEVHTSAGIKEEIKQDANKDTQTHQTTVSVKTPDGTTKTTTTIDTTTKDKMDTAIATTTKVDQTIIPPKIETLNVSFMAGVDFSRQATVYGASVNKQLLGPITIGLFGLTNSTVGLTVGMSF